MSSVTVELGWPNVNHPFFLALAILFSIYAIDLFFLVATSWIARGWENRYFAKTAMQLRKQAEQQQKGKATQGGDAATAAQTEAEFISIDVDGRNEGRQRSVLNYPQAFGIVDHPKMLVQLPMYNEEAVCDLIIERCCKLKWPRDKFLIQVLDDSTKENVRRKVDQAAESARAMGYPVVVMRRTNRQGYKAGAMVEGLEAAKKEGYKYVAIFDADFEPPEDFVYQCVSHLERDPKLGFVQTRWVQNSDSFLTWVQKVNLNFHFEVEQRARSYLGHFFNFNGTAGTWRIAAMDDAGGWESDTVVEDMDLSLRVYLKGWSALYLNHVTCPNEVPSTLGSYKTQQFRWLSGPMQILVKSYWTIWSSKNVGFWRKANCYWFFTRYILFAVVTIAILAVPPAILVFDKWVWGWEQIYFLIAVNLAMVVYLCITPFSLPYLIFSVVIGYFKMYAMLSGLVGSKKSFTWKVTQKFGSSAFYKKPLHKPYTLELLLAMYYGFWAGLAFWYYQWFFFGYCFIMAASFVVVSLGDYYM